MNRYMYEILDDYKHSDTKEEQYSIFNELCSMIWSSNNKRRVFEKSIKYNVSNKISDNNFKELFEKWSVIKFTGYKQMTKDKNYIDLIRQKINNIYTNMFDSNVCIRKEYMDLLKVPKQLYFRYINGEELDYEKTKNTIEDSINESIKVKEKFAKQKMSLSWEEYKKVVEVYLKRICDTYKPLDEYETGKEYIITTDIWNEDSYCVRYFCNSLNGYFKDYQKKYYGVKKRDKIKRCKICCKIFKVNNNKQKYCKECAKNKIKEYDRNRKSLNRKS